MSGSNTSTSLKKKPPKTTITKRITPPITRHNQESATSQRQRSDSQGSDFLYEPSSQPASEGINLLLSTPESQTNNMQREHPGTYNGLNNRGDESNDTGESACTLNLSGILNKTINGTSEMLKSLEEKDQSSTRLTEPKTTNQTFLEETKSISNHIGEGKPSQNIHGKLPPCQNTT